MRSENASLDSRSNTTAFMTLTLRRVPVLFMDAAGRCICVVSDSLPCTTLYRRKAYRRISERRRRTRTTYSDRTSRPDIPGRQQGHVTVSSFPTRLHGSGQRRRWSNKPACRLVPGSSTESSKMLPEGPEHQHAVRRGSKRCMIIELRGGLYTSRGSCPYPVSVVLANGLLLTGTSSCVCRRMTTTARTSPLSQLADESMNTLSTRVL
ncbi:hypothetical protein BV20DRAFT_474336 [Pilatotrama ljubarskyi]|nr:hypothetical protein BV20DRAFT_474336 [Pilatotrama ljubarskyi]